MNFFGAPGMVTLGPDHGQIPAVPMEQPRNLFRYGEQTIWSTYLLTGTSTVANTTNRLFTTAYGQVGQGFVAALSVAETSQKSGPILPAGVAYDVFGIACQVLHGDAANDSSMDFDVPANTSAATADLVNVLNSGVLSWDFTQTSVDIAPVMLVGAGGGIFGAVATTNNATAVGGVGNGNGGVWLYRKHPVALPGQSQFAIVLRFGSRAAPIGTNDIGVRIVLMGYYKNVIEIG